MKPPIDWLLAGEPFVAHRTRRDLLGEPEEALAVRAARGAMLADPRVNALVQTLKAWPGTPLASHKNASQVFHVLGFLTDLGMTAEDPGMDEVVRAILAHRSDEGPFSLPAVVPTRYGGTGAEQWAWALCDAPLVVAGLARLGLQDRPAVRDAVAHLAGLVRANGWPCAVSKELGSFRGPGRTSDPCPFATLAMLRSLAEFPDLRDGAAARAGTETLLSLWEDSHTRHPHMFRRRRPLHPGVRVARLEELGVRPEEGAVAVGDLPRVADRDAVAARCAGWHRSRADDGARQSGVSRAVLSPRA